MTFSYSAEEFESDIIEIENLTTILEETENVEDGANIVEKVSDGIKNVGNSISNLFNGREDNFEKIKKLKELLDMGAITQEEFDAKKTELLDL